MGFSMLAAAMAAIAAVQPQAAETGAAAIGQRLEQALQAMEPPVRVAGRNYRPRPVTDLMQREKVPGISIAVVEDGRVVWARAFGVADSATGQAATVETMFQAASISKPVAASGALALVDQGALDLDRPVNEQLASWQVPAHEFGEPVTLRRLLGHTAGLTVHGFPGYRTDAPLPTIVQVLNGAAPANTDPVRVDIAPGSQWRYSGGGITAAQLLMTDVTGEPFAALMDQLVLRPLGMTHSTYEQPPAGGRAALAASAHDAQGRPIAGRYHLYPEMAAAGLWTTPTDLARWAAAITAAYHGATGGPIRPETARAMLTRGEGNWGLGIGIQGEGDNWRFWHNGVNEGFRAIMMSDPGRRQAVVVMGNGEQANAVLGPVRLTISRVLGWPGSEQVVITPVASTRASRIEQVGHYANERLSAYFGLTEEGLVMVPSWGEPVEMVPQGTDSYALASGGERLRFERDPATGRITGLTAGRLNLRRAP